MNANVTRSGAHRLAQLEEENRARSAQAARRAREEVRRSVAAGRGIVCIRVVDITMASFDPPNASPADAHKIVVQIAQLLGVDDPENATHDAIEHALSSLFSVITGGSSPDEAEAASKLTPSEQKACRAQGCSARDFLRVKAALGTRK